MPFGKLSEFCLDEGKNWSAYVRLVKQFILLNDIKPELHVATLLTHVGAPTYQLMCDLCAPEFPEDKTLGQLIDLVAGHLEPKRSEIAERHTFRQRRQAEGESIGAFLQSLKHLATHCNFGATLEVNIRDQFVSGLRGEEMRSRLFAEPSLDYKKAVELALALEAAERHAAEAVVGAALEAGGSLAGLAPAALAAPMHRVAAGQQSARQRTCWRCGKGAHAPNKCKYKSYICDKCSVKGHLSMMCTKSDKSVGRSRYQNCIIKDSDSASDSSDDLFNVISVKNNSKDSPYYHELSVNNKKVIFEIDTGSKISAVNKSFYDSHLFKLPIIKDNNKFHSYTGDAIVPLGYVNVSLRCGDVSVASLPLFVIDNGGPPLLGRSWLRKLKLTSICLHHLSAQYDPVILQLKSEYPEVFNEGLGSCTTKIKLYLKDDTPIFCKARPLPLALHSAVEHELERLQRDQVIYKVERSDYGTPIVPVIKRDGTIRICGDYKITLNKVLKDFHYPLPRIEQLFAALSGGQQYSKLDLKHAYLQCILDESSQPLTAITTHVGTFVYRRAPFGLKCLPEMFQKIIEDTLSGLHCNGVVAFQDDICVTGPNREVHLSNLKTVLSRLQRAGLRIKFEKCEFFKDEVCYLGYKINKHGLHTDSNKIDAIVNAPVPSNVSQLRAALGLINYYARFIPNMSSILQPLYSLLKKGKHWKWTRACDEAYCAIKDVLIREPVLAHYDPSLPLVLAVDSSSYGLGAVLSHVYPDGTERIVCCASRTLNDAERRYSQIDKEALAIVYGVTRHHQYVYGRHFTLKTDHMALSYIFGPKRGIPQTAASRLQRYAVRLAAYDFDIKFVSTERNSNADALSRLPLQKHRSDSEHDDAAYLHFVEDTFPLSHRDIAKETRKDVILCKIFGYIMSGWPEHIEIESEKPYFNRKDSLHVDHGCIIWGYRIAIPRTLRSQILDELHSGHMGIVRMKQIARNYVWWPNIDADIEARARGCLSCASVRDAPPAVAPVPYIWPASPWSRLHADFLQHNGKYFLLIIDAHSKWLEVFHMHDGTTAIQVIAKFRECFARFGIPKQVVTDGGPPFTSQEFENFLRRNGTKHIVTAPYHPSSNGAAENAVKTVKKALKKAVIDGEHIDRALCKFLLQYRNTAHTSTNQEPAVAMLGRTLRTRLDLLRNCTADHVEKAQETQVRLSKNSAERHVDQGDSVLVRNYSKNNANKWRPGTVVERTGAVTYKIQTGDTLSTKHIDQILPLRKSYRFSMPAALESDNEPIVESESDHLADSSPNPAEIETKDLKLAENIPGTRECSPPRVKTYNLRPRPIRSNRNNKD